MENTRTKTTRNSLILLLTAAIWGMAFVSQSKGMDYMHPFTFNGVRSLIGAASILVYILISRKIAGDKAAPLDWKLNVKAGLLCGIFLTIASTLQQFGIKYTSVGKAGFITTLYIIFVPMFGIFLKKKVAPVVWAAAVMAAARTFRPAAQPMAAEDAASDAHRSKTAMQQGSAQYLRRQRLSPRSGAGG